jgi:hypothetical protein
LGQIFMSNELSSGNLALTGNAWGISEGFAKK